MLNHVSHAAPSADNNPSELKKEQILFDSNSTSATSPTFSVNKDPVYIGCFNLSALDTFVIKMVTNVSPNEQYADYCPVNGPITLSETLTKYRLDMPGRYALVYTGSSNYTSTIVKAFPGEMTHESNSQIAAALSSIAASISSQSNTFINGDSPITVTGTGTGGDPYVVGIDPNSPAIGGLVDITAGAGISVTGNGSSATPYVIAGDLATNAEEEAGAPANKLISAGVLKYIVNATGGATQNARLGVLSGTAVAQGDTSIGYQAGGAGSAGQANNVFVGRQAGFSLGNPVGVVCIGNLAANPAIALGDGSIVIGDSSCGGGAAAIVGGGVVVIGKSAGYSTTGLTNCTVIGYEAAYDSGSNTGSVIIGHSAGKTAQIGFGVAVGNNSIENATNVGTGVYIGSSSGKSTQSLFGTVAIGYEAGLNINYSGQHPPDPNPQTFSDGIFIGKSAGKNQTFYNTIVIGQDPLGVGLQATQNDQIILGNNTQTQLVTAGSVIQGGVIGPSDKRLKKNVENYTSGLEAINKLRPVTFDWDEHAIKQGNINILREELNRKQHGLIAQELEEVFPTFLENVNRGFGDYKFIHNERLIPIMISAIKELSEKVDSLTKELNKKSSKKGVDENG